MDLTRTDWYPENSKYLLDPVSNSSWGARSRFKVPLSRMLIHYIGAGRYMNRIDDGAILKSIEVNHARPNKKPNEYNSGSGINGQSCEYAGPWRAAHSSGKTNGISNNLAWWGHLVFLGSPEVPTEEQADRLIEGILKSRRDLVAMGWLTPDHIVRAHRKAPGLKTGTPCPGPLADNKDWWARISAPLDGSGKKSSKRKAPASGGAGGRRSTIALPGEGWMSIARRVFGSSARWREVAALNGDTAGPFEKQTVALPD